MLPKPYRVQKVARIISDPVANFVSIVGHAATQKPFKVVKSDDEGTTQMAVTMDDIAKQLLGKSQDLTEEPGVTVEADVTRPPASTVMMQKMEFDPAHFDNARIKKYMKTLGFQDYKLISEDEKIIAKSVYFDQFDDNIGRIEGNEPGVVMYVGKLAEAQESGETVKKSEKPKANVPILKHHDAETIKKYDSYYTWYNESTDLGEILSAGMEDGIPPGAYEIGSAFWRVVANATDSGDMAAIKTAAANMGALIVALWEMFSAMSNSENVEIKKMAQEGKEKLVKTDDQKTAEAGDTTADATTATEGASTGEEAGKTEAVAEGDATVQKADEAKPAEADKETEVTPAETTQKAAEPAKEDAVIAAIQKMFDAFKTEVSDSLKKSDERLEKLEGISVQKRSAEVTDAETTKTQKAAETAPEEIKVFKADAALGKLLGL